jgi:hypothetical protein
VYSNESDTDGDGTGNFSPDALTIAPGTLQLRAERDASDNGRVYVIVSEGSDHYGDHGFSCVPVMVPKDQSKAAIAAVTAMGRLACRTERSRRIGGGGKTCQMGLQIVERPCRGWKCRQSMSPRHSPSMSWCGQKLRL